MFSVLISSLLFHPFVILFPLNISSFPSLLPFSLLFKYMTKNVYVCVCVCVCILLKETTQIMSIYVVLIAVMGFTLRVYLVTNNTCLWDSWGLGITQAMRSLRY